MGLHVSTTNQADEQRRQGFSHLYSTQQYDGSNHCPVIYADEYNISFFGIERLHPFDSKKWMRVYHYLNESGMLSPDAVVKPKEARKQDLLSVHSKRYLHSLKSRYQLASILEVALVLLFPTCLVNKRVLRPMRFQTGGSVLAARLALSHGWAINIGGGFHHASRNNGGGFCVYADITLLITVLLEDGFIQRAMIVDLDAHQGNGHERDFTNCENVYIMDMYNANIYPQDHQAKKSISRPVPLESGIVDKIYLPLLARELEAAFADFPAPDLLVYIAGTDSLMGDSLGRLSLSRQVLNFKFIFKFF